MPFDIALIKHEHKALRPVISFLNVNKLACVSLESCSAQPLTGTKTYKIESNAKSVFNEALSK